MDTLGSGLISWFKIHGGAIDEQHMTLSQIKSCGWSAIALNDIPKDYVLFEIPRELLLSTRTCKLKGLLSKSEWARLGKGWTPLILCMMWEAARREESVWDGYLNTMPVTFDTPMFWPEADLEELKGTSIAEKVGRDDANKEYKERLLPLVQSRPDVFNPEHLDTYYTLSQFHIMGSRILSRSFHVEAWDGGEENDSNEEQEQDDNGGDLHAPGQHTEDADVSMESARSEQPPEDEASDGDSDDEEEKVEDVAMVPMADMLNARYGGENAKLFYEPAVLKMITTKPIPAGEQIWNTYGDPPNSDLLRRYGYIDALGTGLDIVELKGNTIVECVPIAEEERKERVDWWLEMGGDDTFTLDMSTLLPPSLLSFAQLLLFSSSEWQHTQEKEKPPKPKSKQVYTSLQEAFTKRLAMYPTTLQNDETELSSNLTSLTNNRRHALTVRIGEKRVLQTALGEISEVLGAGSKKRKAEGESGARKKGKGTKQK